MITPTLITMLCTTKEQIVGTCIAYVDLTVKLHNLHVPLDVGNLSVCGQSQHLVQTHETNTLHQRQLQQYHSKLKQRHKSSMNPFARVALTYNMRHSFEKHTRPFLLRASPQLSCMQIMNSICCAQSKLTKDRYNCRAYCLGASRPCDLVSRQPRNWEVVLPHCSCFQNINHIENMLF